MPARVIVPLPAQSLGRALDEDAVFAQAPLEVTAGGGALVPRGARVQQQDASTVRVAVCGIKGALDAGQEIEVVVKGGWSGELGASKVGGRVALARALGLVLVALVAGQRAGAGAAARAEVLRRGLGAGGGRGRG